MSPIALLFMKTAIFFVGIACSYIPLVTPLFKRHLVDHGYDNPFPPRVSSYGLRKTRRFFMVLMAVGWCGAAIVGFGLYNWLSAAAWLNYGMPFAVGCAFTMIATPLRLWPTLRPWSA